MTDLHRHALRDIDFLDPKTDRFEISVEHIKAEINKRIDDLDRVIAGLPVHPRLCYFTNQDDIDIDLDMGPRPPPRPEQTVMLIAEHPEYQEYFKAVSAYENACAALFTASKRFSRWKEGKKKAKKRRVKGQD